LNVKLHRLHILRPLKHRPVLKLPPKRLPPPLPQPRLLAQPLLVPPLRLRVSPASVLLQPRELVQRRVRRREQDVAVGEAKGPRRGLAPAEAAAPGAARGGGECGVRLELDAG